MSTDPDEPTIQHTHGGTRWDIPVSLLEIQRRWDEVEAECTRLALAGDVAGYKEASGRRLDVTLELYRHPWLIEAMVRGRRFQADQAAKSLARTVYAP